MRRPDAAALLDAWDAGSRASTAERALLLLGSFRPESREQLAGMPIGWIVAQLLSLRAALLGPTLVCLANCGRCDAVVETPLDIDQLTSSSSAELTSDPASCSIATQSGDYRIEFRLPTCADLLALRGPLQRAGRTLGASLIDSATQNGRPCIPADLPEEVHATMERAVLEQDPLTEIHLALACPGCGFEWSEMLDVIGFVWTEVSALAHRLTNEVARIAYSFGWKESDILAMSEQRRQRYLGLLPT